MNAVSGKPIITFKRSIASMGRADAVLTNRATLGTPNNYNGSSYKGHQFWVLTEMAICDVPQVEGKVLAWVDGLAPAPGPDHPLP